MPHRVDETVITTSATVGSRGHNVLGELDMYRRSKGRSKPGRAELFDVIGVFPDSQKVDVIKRAEFVHDKRHARKVIGIPLDAVLVQDNASVTGYELLARVKKIRPRVGIVGARGAKLREIFPQTLIITVFYRDADFRVVTHLGVS